MADPRFVGNAIERFHGRVGSPFSMDLHREYVLIFRVITTSREFGSNHVCQAPGIPRPFSPYITSDGGDYDLDARAVHFDAQKADPDEPLVWDVTVKFSTRMPPGGPLPLIEIGFGFEVGGAQHNPELVPPVLRWDKEVVSRAPPRDLDGLAFTVSNNQPMTPAPTVETGRAVLVIIRNELTFSRETATKYAFAVNHDTFMGAEKGCVRCDPPTAEEDWLGEIHYWKVTYRLVFGAAKLIDEEGQPGEPWNPLNPVGPGELAEDKLESWQPMYLNQGTMEKNRFVGIGPELVPIIRHAVPVTYPVLLDEEGFAQTPNDDGTYTPTWTRRRVYQWRDFVDLIRGFNGRL